MVSPAFAAPGHSPSGSPNSGSQGAGGAKSGEVDSLAGLYGGSQKGAVVTSKGGRNTAPGITVRQIIYHWGSVVWYITKDKVKMTSGLISFVCDQKSGNITFYSDRSHRYLVMPMNNAGTRLRIYNRDTSFTWKEAKKVGQDLVMGEKVDVYVRYGYKKSKDPVASKVEFRDELYCLPGIVFSVPMQKATNALLHGAFQHGFPLKDVRFGYIKGREAHSLQRIVMNEPLSLSRRPIHESTFKIPVGYNKAESEMELMTFSDDEKFGLH